MKNRKTSETLRIMSCAMRLTGLLTLVLGSSFCSSSKASSAPPVAAVTPIPVRPEALAGDWLFEVTRGGNSVQYNLHFSVTGGILAGSMTGPDGNAEELARIALKEDKVAWDVEGDTGTLHYDGTVSGTSMKGTIKRSRGQGGRGGDSSEGSNGSASGGASGWGGGGWGGGGMRGRGGHGGRRGGGSQQMTWSAYKSVAPPAGETASPAPTTTPPG